MNQFGIYEILDPGTSRGKLRNLINLNLQDQSIGNYGAYAISLMEWPELERLNLSINNVDDLGALFLCNSYWPSLN